MGSPTEKRYLMNTGNGQPVNGKRFSLFSKTDALDEQNKVIKEKMNGKLEQINALWDEIENKLVHMQKPRTVAYTYYTDDMDQSRVPIDYNFGIAKVGGKWRLCMSVEEASGDILSCRPISDCTMEERVNAVRHLPGLKKTIVESGEKFLEQMDEATRGLENFLAEF